MEERRQHIRVKAPVMVEFPHPTTMQTERSYTYDISATGLRFPTMVPLRVGQELPITLHLPFQNVTFHATGEVLWLREIARLGTTQYDVGVQFRWIEDSDHQRLEHFLRALATSKLC